MSEASIPTLVAVAVGGGLTLLTSLLTAWLTQVSAAKREAAAADSTAKREAAAAARTIAKAVHDEKKNLYRPLLALCHEAAQDPERAGRVADRSDFHDCAGGVIASGGGDVVRAFRAFEIECRRAAQHQAEDDQALRSAYTVLEGTIFAELHGVALAHEVSDSAESPH